MPLVNPGTSPAIPGITTIASVNVFSDVRALAGGIYPVIQVLGGVTVGDGKDGVFYWSALSVAADDGFAVLAPTLGGTGRWIRIYGAVVQSGTAPTYGWATRTVQAKFGDVISVKDVLCADGVAVAGNGVHDDTTGIQAALDWLPSGGTLYIPRGTYVVSAALSVTKPIQIMGAGWASILQLTASASATTDVLLVKPPSATSLEGFRFQDFYIAPASGTPGRYGINFDGTNGAASYFVVDHVRVDLLGNYALAVTNASGLTTGSPFTTSIRDSIFQGGVDLSNGGDNIHFQNNTVTGVRDVKIGLIGAATSSGGAHGLKFENNNVTSVGGVIVTNAWQGAISDNNIEQTAASTNANNALLDIQGNASANVQGLKIRGNYLGANSLYVADSIRIDRATKTFISGNTVVRGSGVAYRLTANSLRTIIRDNVQLPNGEALSSFYADLGTANIYQGVQETSGVDTVVPSLGFASAAGTTGVFLSASQVKVNATNGLIGSASGDPSTTGLDTALSRLSAGSFAMGTGGFASSAGNIVQTGGIDLGTMQTKRLRANRGTALVAGDFALSAGWGNTAAVSAVIGTDQAWTITVTANGAGIGASPTITLTFHDGTFTNSPITISQMTGGTGTITQLTEAPTATQNVITFQGTPGAGSTYIISSLCIGR